MLKSFLLYPVNHLQVRFSGMQAGTGDKAQKAGKCGDYQFHFSADSFIGRAEFNLFLHHADNRISRR
jgi:hypothetical protein